MTLEPKDDKRKNNLLDLESKLAKTKLSDSEKSCLSHFLKNTAELISCQLPDYTGQVTLHIRDGELTSWKSKAGGRYKE